MERYLYEVTLMFCMSKGLSPIIATMILIGIAISIGAIVSIWISSQSSEYMYKEGDRRERILDKEGESLTLVHVEFDGVSQDFTLRLQNNGTSDLEVAYMLLNRNDYYSQTDITCSPSCELEINQSGQFTVTTGFNELEDIQSVEIGTTLGSLFIYNAPSPVIRITNTVFDANNKLVTFSGADSTDDEEIVEWLWDFSYDSVAGFSEEGSGVLVTYSYSSSGSYDVALKVTDNTGMIGFVVLENVSIP